MSALPRPRWTAEEYLVYERQAEAKSEFLDGELFAMAGASREHNIISLNVAVALHPQLVARGCEEYMSDMRVHIPATGLYTYPDVTAACGEPRFSDEQRDTLVNPTLIIEVLSPSTADYDRGRKFAHYRSLPSLQVYLLIASDEIRVERFVRQPSGEWLLTEFTDLDATVDLPGLEAQLPLTAIYRQVPRIG
ncbi:MAG: Uma2 family endonuclease [Thermoanaerobaculia bacterium]|nr:Uma2 family endonuclease [Thermoanaerobaculia bacterium]